MKVNILKRVLIILLVFTLTSTNFLFVGASAFSYAVDIYNSEIETNNKNVTFDVYFKDENGNKITNKELHYGKNQSSRCRIRQHRKICNRSPASCAGL